MIVMGNKFLIFIVLVLLGVNFVTLFFFDRYKKNTIIHLNSLLQSTDELMTLHANFITGIENSNIQLEDVITKDSLNVMLPLDSVFRKNQSEILVCRFSEMDCESCINYSINTLLQWSNKIGKDNILFLGTYRNNKIFNKQKPLYGIDTLNTVNVDAINLPVEDCGHPYYFILDSTLRVLNVFLPNKGTPSIDNKYLESTCKKYFNSSRGNES